MSGLAEAHRAGVPFVEQAERMPRDRPVAMAAVYYRTYATRDAALAVACGSPSLRRKFIAALGHKDPALAGGVTDLGGALRDAQGGRGSHGGLAPTAEWPTILAAAGVPASRAAFPLRDPRRRPAGGERNVRAARSIRRWGR